MARPALVLFAVLAAAGVAMAAEPAVRGAAAELTVEDARARFEEILPPEHEMSWSSIPWRPTMLEGVIDANAQDKPIVLYQMRGHPMGAT